MLKLLLLVLLFSLPSNASPNSLYLTAGSHHTESGNFCETNPGFLYEFDNRYLFGSYRNSNCDWVGVIGKTVYRSKQFYINQSPSYVTLPVGIIAGYESYPVLPLFMPTVVIEINSHSLLALSIIPLKEPVFGFGMVFHQ